MVLSLFRSWGVPASVACFALSPLASAQAVLQRIDGEADWDYLGASVAAAGDVDGDGFADWIVGADSGDEYGGTSGYALVHSGLTGELLHRFEVPFEGRFGHAVAGLGGDADGDGADDLLVGAYRADHGGVRSGRIWLFSGRTGEALLTVDGEEPFAGLGRSLAAMGDLDGDGVPDFAAGMVGPSYRQVHVFSGADGAKLLSIQGPPDAGDFGFAIDLAGDLDGDGVGDLLVGAPNDDSGFFKGGSVRVYSGASGELLLEILGPSPHGKSGWAVAGLGDLDGDGIPDFAVGAPYDATVAVAAGAVRVHSGADGRLLREFLGDRVNDAYGYALDGPGDMDGDGLPELLVGSPHFDVAGYARGAVHLISGATGAIVLSQNGGGNRGYSVAAIGDTNGDGVSELASGAPHHRPLGGLYIYWGRADLIDGAVRPVAPYCSSAPNSTGEEARIAQLGRTDVASNDFHLTAGGLPEDALALFLIAPGRQLAPFGDGWRCVDGDVKRLLPAGTSDDHGDVGRQIDLSSPAPGVAPIQPGDRWFFQLWYRDAAAGGSGFNLSNGLVATFGP